MVYIRIRNTVSSETVMIPNLSKLDTIGRIKELVFERMKVEPGKQRLYYQGKELENSLGLHDYSVKNNDTIQLMPKSEKEPLGESQVDNIPGKKKVEAEQEKKKPEAEACEVKEAESHYFKVGDELDCKDPETGAWFEAVIKRITENEDVKGVDNLTYHVEWEGYGDDMEAPAKVKLDQLRPRAKTKIPFEDLDIKKEIMVNYNLETPEERGFWYDAVVTKWLWSDKKLVVTVKGPNKDIPNCQIMFTGECYKVEPVAYVTADKIKAGFINCSCKGVVTKKCFKCGCRICGGQDNPDELIMCDDCDIGYHTKCLGMSKVPAEDEWFCPLCKRNVDIVGAGGSKQMAKKKLSDNNRDWGKGMACVGRTKNCDKVAKNHFGPIPGIGVGQSWLYRIQLSEEGVHRPPVGGIAGTAKEGCQSIVLAGGYEDDEDNGDSFTYTGSGGRDLSGNKRCAGQSFDQTLERSNAAIAKNCKARFDAKKGGDAGDKWREGMPIRVVRNCKGRKHSIYAPEEGNRYDGIYKVVKYWPEKGKSGFIVWKYLFRRDDPAPAPWTEEGKKIIEEEGYEMIYPDGYLEAEEAKAKEKKRNRSEDEEGTENVMEEDDENDGENDEAKPSKNKKARTCYKIAKDWMEAIEKDEENKNLWEQVKSKEVANKKELLEYVEEQFCCIICQDLAFQPITTPCHHNFCKNCMLMSFQASEDPKKKSCPSCRYDLGEKYKLNENSVLKEILNLMFPGYETGR